MKVWNQSLRNKKEERFRGQRRHAISVDTRTWRVYCGHDSIDQVPYKTAYSKPQGRSKKGKLKITVKLSEISIVSPNKEQEN
jgi:hypothetical protein